MLTDEKTPAEIEADLDGYYADVLAAAKRGVLEEHAGDPITDERATTLATAGLNALAREYVLSQWVEEAWRNDKDAISKLEGHSKPISKALAAIGRDHASGFPKRFRAHARRLQIGYSRLLRDAVAWQERVQSTAASHVKEASEEGFDPSVLLADGGYPSPSGRMWASRFAFHGMVLGFGSLDLAKMEALILRGRFPNLPPSPPDVPIRQDHLSEPVKAVQRWDANLHKAKSFMRLTEKADGDNTKSVEAPDLPDSNSKPPRSKI